MFVNEASNLFEKRKKRKRKRVPGCRQGNITKLQDIIKSRGKQKKLGASLEFPLHIPEFTKQKNPHPLQTCKIAASISSPFTLFLFPASLSSLPPVSQVTKRDSSSTTQRASCCCLMFSCDVFFSFFLCVLKFPFDVGSLCFVGDQFFSSSNRLVVVVARLKKRHNNTSHALRAAPKEINQPFPHYHNLLLSLLSPCCVV